MVADDALSWGDFAFAGTEVDGMKLLDEWVVVVVAAAAGFALPCVFVLLDLAQPLQHSR